MGYFFLALVTVFALACWIYLIINDFAPETLETIFPAIGAILLSVYLGYKSIAIDRPAPRRFGATVALLHDETSGTLSGLALRAAAFLPNPAEFEGSRLIDTIPIYNAFKSLNLQGRLQGPAGEPAGEVDQTLESILEYALLEWLGRPEQLPGYTPAGSTLLISAYGGGGGVPTNLAGATTAMGSAEYNPLVATQPVILRLPAGSTFARSRTGGTQIYIRTRRSVLTIRIAGHSGQRIGPPFGRDATRLHAALQLPANPQALSMHGYRVNFEFRVLPLTRYSKQAKVEVEWARRLEAQFDRDFSWERLRAILARAG